MITDSKKNEATREFVTLMIAGQVFGVEVKDIHDVFQPDRITPVPLAPPEICGVLNLRGRVVTAVDARVRLGLQVDEQSDQPMAVGVDCNGESYGLIVDSVNEVMRLPDSAYEANPVNLDPRWQEVSQGVYRLEDQLLVVLDLGRMLRFGEKSEAA